MMIYYYTWYYIIYSWYIYIYTVCVLCREGEREREAERETERENFDRVETSLEAGTR